MPEISGISYDTNSVETEIVSATDTVQGVYSVYQEVCNINEDLTPYMKGAVLTAFDRAAVNIEVNLLEACKAFNQSTLVLTNLNQEFERYEEELSTNAGGYVNG